jgi:flagellar assembly factor FliW
MKIDTKDFGLLEIEEGKIVHFQSPIMAFEEATQFALIERDGYMQKWLQSVQGKDPRFIVFNPDDIIQGYYPSIPIEVLKVLELQNGQKPCLFVIAVVPEDIKDMTINLKSPIIINFHKRLAAQVILDNENYPVRYRVFKDNEVG